MTYEAFVIGAGPAGTVCAGELADGAMRAGIAERVVLPTGSDPPTFTAALVSALADIGR